MVIIHFRVVPYIRQICASVGARIQSDITGGPGAISLKDQSIVEKQ